MKVITDMNYRNRKRHYRKGWKPLLIDFKHNGVWNTYSIIPGFAEPADKMWMAVGGVLFNLWYRDIPPRGEFLHKELLDTINNP